MNNLDTCPDCSNEPCICGLPAGSGAGETEPPTSGSERRLVRRCRWCGMADCGTTGGNDHGSGFVNRSDKCKLWEAMECYCRSRDQVAKLEAKLEQLRNIVTTGNESKESFIRRVSAVLNPPNVKEHAPSPAGARARTEVKP